MSTTGLQSLDYIVFFIYLIGVSAYGYWIYKKKSSKEVSSTDYFLAEGSLTFWAIGASIIASNISAEHFIGMSGSGFAIAKIMGFAAIVATISGDRAPFTDRPKKTSAPFMASARVRAFVSTA